MHSYRIRTSRTGEREFDLNRITVLLGANGTGKSKLLQELQGQAPTYFPNYTPVRIEGGRAIEMKDSLELDNRNFSEFRTFDQMFNGFKQRRAQTLGSRLFYGLKTLEQMGIDSKIKHSDEIVEWEQNGEIGNRPKQPEDPMSRVFEIFNDIFPSISLRYRSNDRRLLCKKDGNEYGPTGLSDGEKQVFSILVDAIELTDDQSILFVDEPELNLNPGLANRLWTSIESLLPDAIFVYATHSVNFAMRDAVQQLLVLSNDGTAIQKLDDLEELPFDDQRELLGNIPALLSHSNALVVEGHDESFDSVFYRWLLSDIDFLPAPVGGSEDVIAITTRAGKWQRISPDVRLTGIIDRDYKSDTDVAQLEAKGLVVLEYHEAESYLCHPRLLAALIAKLGTIEPIPKENEIRDRLVSYIKKHEISICAKRANDRLKQSIRPSVPSKTLSKINSYEDLERVFLADVEGQMKLANATFDKGNVRSVLQEEKDRIGHLETAFDVDSALKLLPAKELLDEFAKWFELTDTNTLARAARTHLDVAEFPELAALQTKLNLHVMRK